MVTHPLTRQLDHLLRSRGISPELRHNILCNLSRANGPAIARTIRALLAMPAQPAR
jgi:hypothetical protein